VALNKSMLRSGDCFTRKYIYRFYLSCFLSSIKSNLKV
jgi:hypothetical protein